MQGSTVQKNTNQGYQQPKKEHAWGEQQMNSSNNKRGQMYLKKREQQMKSNHEGNNKQRITIASGAICTFF